MAEDFADIFFWQAVLGMWTSKCGQLWQIAMVTELQYYIAGNRRTAALPAVLAKGLFSAVPCDLAECIVGKDQRMVW